MAITTTTATITRTRLQKLLLGTDAGAQAAENVLGRIAYGVSS